MPDARCADVSTVESSSTHGIRARWAWWVYLALAVLGAAAYMLAPVIHGNGFFFNALGLSSVVAILIGVAWHRPAGRLPWILLALGQALFVAGDVIAYNYQRIFHHEQPFPS